MMRHAPVRTATNETKQTRRQRKRRLSKRTATRLRLLRKRASGWKRRARRAATLALVSAVLAQAPLSAHAQFGQAPMGQPQGLTNGVVNNGLARLSEINNAGPGFLYYGVNGADRGLGYIGSYMTLGGFIPYAQDNLGGFWSADLRGHLSVNGGFFSNVGVVRKQILGGGSLLGVGVYWDYDGDLYQYGGEGDSTYGQFGHVYNQVGVSGEILTDWGNLRSNGYMPVGTTAYTVGSPGTTFYQNQILCQYGLDAALGGADLEVGAYVPALADFAGMISVGGYALGNSFNKWQTGSNSGLAIVPWFGGVYTRIDMTFANNWDFSLQYNNDSYFDSTGFARLTYRMGGSRRRNVPDQLEQPMMRNEHIVRAHQTPEIVMNPQNGNALWNVIHVNNAAAAGGNGTAEAPFTTLQEAQAAATSPWDIVYVNEGTSTLLSGTTYGGTFAFQQPNQFLVGSGGPLTLAAQPGCGVNGLFTIAAQTTANPVLSNPAGTSVDTNGQGGVTLANLTVTGSGEGLVASGGMDGTAQPFGTTANPYGTSISNAGGSSVRNVTFTGDGTAAAQRGVRIDGATGGIEFTDTSIANMTRTGLLIQNNTGTTDVSYNGIIFSDTTNTGGQVSPLIVIRNNSGTGNYDIASGNPPAGSLITANQVTDVGGEGIIIQANAATNTIDIGNVSLTDTVDQGIYVFNDQSTTSIRSDAGTGIVRKIDGAAILVSQGSPTFSYFGTASNSPPAGGAPGYLLQVDATTGGSVTLDGPGATPFTDKGDGILIQNALGTISVTGASLESTGATAIRVAGTPGTPAAGTYIFNNIEVTGGTSDGILLSDLSGTTTFSDLTMNLPGTLASGFSATAAGAVSIGGASSIETASATMPAIKIYDNGSGDTTTPNYSLTTVISANETTIATPFGDPPFGAISLDSANPGTINISSAFTIDGTSGTQAGTGDNVNNPSSVPVFVGGAQISP